MVKFKLKRIRTHSVADPYLYKYFEYGRNIYKIIYVDVNSDGTLGDNMTLAYVYGVSKDIVEAPGIPISRLFPEGKNSSIYQISDSSEMEAPQILKDYVQVKTKT